MAKKIFSSREDINNFLNSARSQLLEMEQALTKKKFQGSNDREATLKFKMNDICDNRSASIEFTPKAWIKMRSLVDSFSSEVQWHGTVTRKNINTFVIKDILIFPHEVTGTTVVSNQEGYEEWLNNLDDETFNACRFHGHSHVNMGVTPSGVDMNYRHNVLDNFGSPNDSTDLFYIFLITNKRGEISAEIYDLQNNALYSTNEIDIDVAVDNDEYLFEFISEAKSVVKDANTVKKAQPETAKQSSAKSTNYSRSCAYQRSLLDEEDDYEEEAYRDWHNRVYGGRY